jgi:hypothetical protein
MGKREKEKQKRVQEFVQGGSQRNIIDVENKMLELRSEVAMWKNQFTETLIRITKELSSMRHDLNIFNRALAKTGIISQSLIDSIMEDMKSEQRKMIDENGRMSGNPVVTCYNCDFKLDSLPYKVVEVRSI